MLIVYELSYSKIGGYDKSLLWEIAAVSWWSVRVIDVWFGRAETRTFESPIMTRTSLL